MKEENFPRGGHKPSHTQKKATPQKNLFSTIYERSNKKTKKPKSAVRKLRKNASSTNTDHEFISDFASMLSYSNLQENMLVLANVRAAKAMSLNVELPGRCYGTLKITEISDHFTTELQRHLNKNDEDSTFVRLRSLFTPGTFLPVKILQITSVQKGHRLELTTKPSSINSNLRHASFRKGMLVWASVVEALEHGYQLDVGAPNCRVFLPHKKVEDGRKYVVGEPLWCAIHVCNSTPEATTLTVSALDKHVSCTPEPDDLSLQSITPGVQLEFRVTRLLRDGLQGTVLSDYKAYINESHLKSPVLSLDEYREGQTLKARVLYVAPTTKFVHMTLRGLEKAAEAALKVGEIMTGEVIDSTFSGVFMKLNKTDVGFVTYKRLVRSLTRKRSEGDLKDAVKKAFKNGSRHQCRILDYSRMDRLYICTCEQDVLKDEAFTADDLKIGQLVKVKVTQIQDDGVAVNLGHLPAFVQNIQLSNFPYSESVKSKFQVGQVHTARVLNVVNKHVLLTFKQTLIDSDDCLASYEQAVPETRFPGVVVDCHPAGALVAFYGNVRGWIPNVYLLPESKGQRVYAKQLFFVGQVIAPKVVEASGERMTLSMLPVVPTKKRRVKLGKVENVVVSKMTEMGLEVDVGKRKAPAFVPLEHVSWSYPLNPLLLDTFGVREGIEAFCVDVNGEMPVLSIREALAYNESGLTIPEYETLKEGDLIRCSFIGKVDNGIFVSSPIIGFNKTLKILDTNLLDDDVQVEKLSFYVKQAIVAKVTKIKGFMRKIHLSAKLSDVFNFDSQYSQFLLEQHIKNVNKIRTHLRNAKESLANYNLGERVPCTVTKVGKNGCSVLLPDGKTRGSVLARHCTDVQTGAMVEGVVLWVDFINKCVDLALKPEIVENVMENKQADVEDVPESTEHAEILLSKQDFTLAVLKHSKRLVFLPSILHENDFKGLVPYYSELLGTKIEVSIRSGSEDFLIGFETGLAQKLSERTSKKSKERSKRKITDENESVKKVRRSSASEEDASSETEPKSRKKKHSESEEPTSHVAKKPKTSPEDIKIPPLPGVDDFFSPIEPKEEPSSSSEDETLENSEHKKAKKKKLSAAERAELARLEEERIRKIEDELADSKAEPQSAEQFERLLLGRPNASEIWARYIAFHLSTTEIEKARATAKRALETIDMTEIQEKLNVWITYLNLENMYGTKETFEKVFAEAIRYNDDYVIYLESIKMLAEMEKYEEMDEKIKKFKGKFKSRAPTWIEIARVLYKIKRFDEARKIKVAAIRCVQDNRKQTDMLVQFAILEFNFGEQDQGEVLFETILTSYPRRVDVWCVYVDQLTKAGKIDIARKTLERSVCQKRLSLMKMRTLFRKFKAFEEAHGTPESVERVKQALVDYVAKVADVA